MECSRSVKRFMVLVFESDQPIENKSGKSYPVAGKA